MLRFHQEHLASAEEREQQRAHRRRATWPEACLAPQKIFLNLAFS
jgi:hypothetical protein